jgi:hypothetical protein
MVRELSQQVADGPEPAFAGERYRSQRAMGCLNRLATMMPDGKASVSNRTARAEIGGDIDGR